MLEIDILAFNGKVIASRRFQHLPRIVGLNNTVFAVEFGDQVTVDQSKSYVRARFIPVEDNQEFDSFSHLITFDTFYFYTRPKDLQLHDPDIVM